MISRRSLSSDTELTPPCSTQTWCAGASRCGPSESLGLCEARENEGMAVEVEQSTTLELTFLDMLVRVLTETGYL